MCPPLLLWNNGDSINCFSVALNLWLLATWNELWYQSLSVTFGIIPNFSLSALSNLSQYPSL